MNNEAQMTNGRAAIDTLQFVIRHSDLFRHSSFVFRHLQDVLVRAGLA